MIRRDLMIYERPLEATAYDNSTGEEVVYLDEMETVTLNVTATAREITNSVSTTVATFYNAQKATMQINNSLIVPSLLAQQLGSEIRIADSTNKILVPRHEDLEIDTSGTDPIVTLKHLPLGEVGNEIPSIKLFNNDFPLGKILRIGAAVSADDFVLDASTGIITFDTGIAGHVHVNYQYAESSAIAIAKYTDSVPKTLRWEIDAIFHDVCDPNIKYLGTIVGNAQVDITSITLFDSEKHNCTLNFVQNVCSPNKKLIDIIWRE